MIKLLRFALLSVSLLTAQGLAQPAAQPDFRAKVDELRGQAISIRTIDASDTDFDDLRPIAEKIGTARIVVLGEATHSEGATAQAKCRLIKFLHQEMGFDVLAWEAGFLNCAVMNDLLRSDVPLRQAKRHMMSGGWDSQTNSHPVFEYARQSWKTSHPLIMAGIDGNRPPHGVGDLRHLLEDAHRRAPQLDLSPKELESIDEVFAVVYGFMSAKHTATDAVRKSVRQTLTRLQRQFENPAPSSQSRFSARELKFMARVVHLALAEEENRTLRDRSDEERAEDPGNVAFAIRRNNNRDRTMAENLLWLADVYYPDRKIIVWCATAHMMQRAMLEIEPIDWKKGVWDHIEHMGDHMKRAMGREVYVIGITAFGGEVGQIFPEGARYETRTSPIDPSPPPAGSFEDLCHRAGFEYAFVDLRGVADGHWLAEPLVAWPLAFARCRARWGNVLDAFLFIDTMTPARMMPRNP